MQSPAPVAKKITGRTDSGDSSKNLSIDNIIENIDAIKSVTDLGDKKKNQSDDSSSDSSGTTITEDRNNPPETEGGPIGVVEGSELPISEDPKVGVLPIGVLTDNSSSTDSSSTGGSSKSDISSSDSSDSTRSLITYDSSDSNSFIASKADRNMSSSMKKSPICDGERDSFEEWHSKWEVSGQDHRFDEYQYDIRHPDLPVDGHVSVTMTNDQKRRALDGSAKVSVYFGHLGKIL
jgi:hypothetical protein